MNESAVAAVALGFSFLPLHFVQAHEYTLHILHDFCAKLGCRDGQQPNAGLIADASGDLFGTTISGGATGGGVIFELVPSGDKAQWAYRVLHNFCPNSDCKDGAVLNAPLILDNAGSLYGITTGGGRGNHGVVFKLMPSADQIEWTYKVLYKFCGMSTDSYCPEADGFNFGLSYAGQASGAPYDGTSPLYGISAYGGDQLGNVFALSPNSDRIRWRFKQLYAFCSDFPACADGSRPWLGNVVVDGAGNLFGTTMGGGAFGQGTLFKLNWNGQKWTESVVHSFCSAANCADGANPSGSLTIDGTGRLVGTAASGDMTCAQAPKCGVIFRLAPSTGKEVVAGLFCQQPACADGNGPQGDLAMDSNGRLFGTTFVGGGNAIDRSGKGGGTVFRVGNPLHILHRFCSEPNCTDGEYPCGKIVVDAAGNVFGTTQLGGAQDAGVVFELSP